MDELGELLKSGLSGVHLFGAKRKLPTKNAGSDWWLMSTPDETKPWFMTIRGGTPPIVIHWCLWGVPFGFSPGKMMISPGGKPGDVTWENGEKKPGYWWWISSSQAKILWLVVRNKIFSPYIGNVIIPTDEVIFFTGVAIPPTRLFTIVETTYQFFTISSYQFFPVTKQGAWSPLNLMYSRGGSSTR